uniref:AB hydrolase-1 domain-containing protein n=1 Tax=Odontella aurita TaxID=265563 RepID=A0A7S4JKJ3_9STRA|mmetsp:Transcript_48018/g.145054  ORF Transcript_48018/g.145054 Transcript_48018/m.145054 type:complete len:314 (+) Transcript_48018:225-1166(+)
MSAGKMTKNDEQNTFEDKIELRAIRDGSRTIAFSTAGDSDGDPVLYWYPGGGNRRLLLSYHKAAIEASLHLICVNRPGMGGTSLASGRSPADHTSTACEDAIAVLDFLGVGQVNLLFMCAGAPFALAFASRYPTRLSGQLVGIAPYVLPADCVATKALHRFGACHCPIWLSSHAASSVTSSMMGSFSSLPDSLIKSSMLSPLSPEEREVFDNQIGEEDFLLRAAWMFEETGSRTADFAVLMSRGEDLGFKYGKINGNLTVFNGENDKMVPIGAAEWLTQQIEPSSLIRLSGGSHEGALFLVHPDVKDALKILK